MLGRSGVVQQGRADESSMVMVTVASAVPWSEVEALGEMGRGMQLAVQSVRAVALVAMVRKA